MKINFPNCYEACGMDWVKLAGLNSVLSFTAEKTAEQPFEHSDTRAVTLVDVLQSCAGAYLTNAAEACTGWDVTHYLRVLQADGVIQCADWCDSNGSDEPELEAETPLILAPELCSLYRIAKAEGRACTDNLLAYFEYHINRHSVAATDWERKQLKAAAADSTVGGAR